MNRKGPTRERGKQRPRRKPDRIDQWRELLQDCSGGGPDIEIAEALRIVAEWRKDHDKLAGEVADLKAHPRISLLPPENSAALFNCIEEAIKAYGRIAGRHAYGGLAPEVERANEAKVAFHELRLKVLGF